MISKPLCLAVLFVSLFTFFANPAHACWDGYSAQSSRVTISRLQDDTSGWSVGRAKMLAKALRQIESVLGEGQSVVVSPSGSIQICGDVSSVDQCTEHTKNWDNGAPWTLVELVFELTHADGAARRSAALVSDVVYSVQAASTTHASSAQSIADSINQSYVALHGFYEEGGFPATNPVAHVVEHRAGNTTYFRVMVGAFLTEAQAKSAGDEVRKITQNAVWVHSL